MNISHEIGAVSLRFDAETMWVDLIDARTLGIPLAWFPRLLNATPEQRDEYLIGYGGTGIHWDLLDEDVSVAALLEGRGDQTQHHPQAA